jgi:hypothetical protein
LLGTFSRERRQKVLGRRACALQSSPVVAGPKLGHVSSLDSDEAVGMAPYKPQNFGDRLNTAASAKKAALEKFEAKSAALATVSAEKQAERIALAAAREARAAERELAKQAKTVQDAQAKAERQAAQAEAKLAEEARLAEESVQEANLEIERKAARDARYAARKARK